jgi:hypothetical protein
MLEVRVTRERCVVDTPHVDQPNVKQTAPRIHQNVATFPKGPCARHDDLRVHLLRGSRGGGKHVKVHAVGIPEDPRLRYTTLNKALNNVLRRNDDSIRQLILRDFALD